VSWMIWIDQSRPEAEEDDIAGIRLTRTACTSWDDDISGMRISKNCSPTSAADLAGSLEPLGTFPDGDGPYLQE